MKNKSIAQIDKEYQDKQSALFDLMGVFWAFGKEQFEKKKQEGVEYSQIWSLGGMLVPTDKVEIMLDGLRMIASDSREDYRNHVNMDAYILKSLNEHETFYDGDLERCEEDILFYFPDCTKADIKRIYFANLKDGYDE